MHGVLNESSDAAEWLLKEEDLTALSGQPVRLRFSVADDGAGTTMYVDNVSILACQQTTTTGSATSGVAVVDAEVDAVVVVPTVDLERPLVAATATFPPSTEESNLTVVTSSPSWWVNLTSSRLGTILILFCIVLIIFFIFWGLRTLFRPRR